jgi:hypothetical protein
MSQRFLWEFYYNYGRIGSVSGLFVASEEEIESSIGEYVRFGEILGKYSDVSLTLDKSNLTKVNLDSETVEKVTDILGETWSGRNPLNYIRCSGCGCCQEDCYCNDEEEEEEGE